MLLLAFILLGRALEARARAQASADLRSLAALLPEQARLVVRARAVVLRSGRFRASQADVSSVQGFLGRS